MAENGWQWLGWLEMAGHLKKWLRMNGIDCKRLKMAGSGWNGLKWLEMAGNDKKQLRMS